jgi:hypothetical protein
MNTPPTAVAAKPMLQNTARGGRDRGKDAPNRNTAGALSERRGPRRSASRSLHAAAIPNRPHPIAIIPDLRPYHQTLICEIRLPQQCTDAAGTRPAELHLSVEGKGPLSAATASGRRSYTAEQIGDLRTFRDQTGRATRRYRPYRRGHEHLQAIAVVNLKGGSCKPAANLAQHLALRGFVSSQHLGRSA